MRLPAVLVLASLCVSAQQPTVQYKRKVGPNTMTAAQQQQATRDYRAALHNYCPRQRIDLQSPVQLNLQLQDFEHFLSPREITRYRQIVDESCILHDPSPVCTNTAMLAAAQEGKFLDRFAVFQCEKGIRCTATGKCSGPRH